MKIFSLDSEEEFCASNLMQFFHEKRILAQQSCPNIPEQNGVVERNNHHVLEIAQTLLLEYHVLLQLWVKIVHIVIYLINQQTTPILGNQSSYFSLYNKLPNYLHLHVFECVCFVIIFLHEQNKLTTKATKCVFVGIMINKKAMVAMIPNIKECVYLVMSLFLRIYIFMFHPQNQQILIPPILFWMIFLILRSKMM